jgi:hypothetical protein
MAILRNLKADEAEELRRLRAENAALKTAQTSIRSFKIGDKGGLSVYGLGRFPVTLYKEQWERLLEHKDVILAYIADNGARMKTRD